ncbi:MAG: Clp protease ClpP [Rikenellaceae bacterium]|nr:Clp protease ClpP [Rikenellaceae bacterium]
MNNTYELNISGIIGDSTEYGENFSYPDFSDKIEEIKSGEVEDLVINIRSVGGNVNDALMIYDDLTQLDMQITTRCYGYVASAATIIAQAASASRREISDNAMYLIHKSSTFTEGNTSEINRTIDMLEKTDEKISRIYAAKSGRTPEEFLQLMGKNNGKGEWLTAEQAIEEGLADRIIAGEKIMNDISTEISLLGLPQIPSRYGHSISPAEYLRRMILRLRNYSIPEISSGKSNNAYRQRIEQLESKISDMEKKIRDNGIFENKIKKVEFINNKFSAKPTATKPKEDPSHYDFRTPSNTRSYEKDLKNFKQ